MKKIAFFGFTGELLCFAHILFNAEDMLNKGIEVKIILEGKSTSLIPVLPTEENPFNKIYHSLVAQNDIISVCQACAHKMGTLEEARRQNLTLENVLYGHPSIEVYMKDGYEVITI